MNETTQDAPAATPDDSHKNAAPWVIGGTIVLILFGMLTHKSSPEDDAKYSAKSAIEECWKSQERKSLDPGTARFVAGVCEKMQGEYDAKYH